MKIFKLKTRSLKNINLNKTTIKLKFKLKFNKRYPDGTKRKILDNTILKKFGWKPKISLKNGLENTIKWYVENSK